MRRLTAFCCAGLMIASWSFAMTDGTPVSAASTFSIYGSTSCGSSGDLKCWSWSSGGTTVYSATRNSGVSPTSTGITSGVQLSLSAGDSVSFTTDGSNHNIVVCASGSTVNGWNCGDPITSYSVSGLTPGGTYASTGAGSPAAAGGSGGASSGSVTFSSTGTYYFYCTVSSMHYYDGMYGKVVVSAAATTTTAAPTTMAAPTTTAAPSTTAPTTATTAAPTTATTAAPTTATTSNAAVTISASRKGTKVTLSGTAGSGARVTVQRQSGSNWVTAGHATAGSNGKWTWSVTAKAANTYRAQSGSQTSKSVKK